MEGKCTHCGACIEIIRPLRDAVEVECTKCGFREVRGLEMFKIVPNKNTDTDDEGKEK